MSRLTRFPAALALALVCGCGGSTAEKAVEDAKEATERAAADTKEAAAGLHEAASEAVSEAKDAAVDAAEDAKAAAGDAVDAATTAMKEGFDAVSAAASEALKGVEGGGELLKKVTDLFGSATKDLQGVTDVDTGRAALPKLHELTGSLEGLKATIDKLPAEAKAAITSVIDKGVEQLEALAHKVMDIPGVSDVVKPEVDKLIQGIKDLRV